MFEKVKSFTQDNRKVLVTAAVVVIGAGIGVLVAKIATQETVDLTVEIPEEHLPKETSPAAG